MSNALSAVIITYNEEKNIGRCIDSLQDVAEEIIVLDSNSTDATCSIAEAKGAKVFQQAFLGYVAQKNAAASKASYDRILSLDADEALSEELLQSIREAKNNWTKDAYIFNRITNYCGRWIRHGGWYPDLKVRLYDRRKAGWTGGDLHEKIEWKEGANLGKLQGELLHYSFYTVSDHLKVIDKFTDIQARELFKKGKKPNLFHLRISPQFKFLRDYVFRFGFLDGFHGYCIAILSAKATFIKYAKLKLLYTKDEYR